MAPKAVISLNLRGGDRQVKDGRERSIDGVGKDDGRRNKIERTNERR